MLVPPLPEDRLVDDWYVRHSHRGSLVLHVVGIPLLVLSIVLVPLYLVLVSPALLLLSLACFAGSYAIQFLGHALDRSEPGELTQLRKLWARRRDRARLPRPAQAEVTP